MTFPISCSRPFGLRRLQSTQGRLLGPAGHSKNTCLSFQYRRLAGRRGKKRAIVAVGHALLVIMYHVLRNGLDYSELGQHYLDKLQPRRLTTRLVKRPESLGHKATFAPAEQAAQHAGCFQSSSGHQGRPKPIQG